MTGEAAHQPADRGTITPRIFTHDVPGLFDFLVKVFGAEGDLQRGRPTDVRIGDSLLIISDGGGVRRPMGACLYVYVPDTDAVFARAVAAGARAVELPTDQFYGDRRATIEDDWGNVWQIATSLDPAAVRI